MLNNVAHSLMLGTQVLNNWGGVTISRKEKPIKEKAK